MPRFRSEGYTISQMAEAYETGPESEIGRRLAVSELKERTIVVLMKEGRPAATFWFMGADKTLAIFGAHAVNATLMLSIDGDGTMRDDSGADIKAFEYLGEP